MEYVTDRQPSMVWSLEKENAELREKLRLVKQELEELRQAMADDLK